PRNSEFTVSGSLTFNEAAPPPMHATVKIVGKSPNGADMTVWSDSALPEKDGQRGLRFKCRATAPSESGRYKLRANYGGQTVAESELDVQ
ncbi:MAG TPA: hypothetical protein VF306_06470, partial [Pirellulales bacterium]